MKETNKLNGMHLNVGPGEENINKIIRRHLFILFWDIHDDDKSCYGSYEGKDHNKKVNNVVPRGAAEEYLGSQDYDPQNYL